MKELPGQVVLDTRLGAGLLPFTFSKSWGTEALFAGLQDHVGLRASSRVYVPPGGLAVTFESSSNNGSRLYVDGIPVIDSWEKLVSGAGLRSKAARIALAEGTHELTLEYYEWDEAASLAFSVDKPDISAWCEAGSTATEASFTKWQVQWYDHAGFRWGNPLAKREVWPAVFDRTGIADSSDTAFVAKAAFFVHGTAPLLVKFTVGNDDGAALSVDGTDFISDWETGSYRATTAGAVLAPGKHSLELRYFQSWMTSRVSFSVDTDEVLSWCE